MPRNSIIKIWKVKRKIEKLKNSKRKKKSNCNIQRKSHKAISQQKLCRPKRSDMKFKVIKRKTSNQEYFTQRGYHSELTQRERERDK